MTHTAWDAIIVGGGPAGLSAALMLGRSRRRVLVIDAGEPRNRFASHMHGVLGHDGTPPGELLARGRAEASVYGVEFVDAHVTSVTTTADSVEVTTASATHNARALIVATGITDDLPPVPGLAERWGETVLHCPYCHGWEVRDQRIGVLLTSPMGLHQAELARQLSAQVTVFTSGIAGVDAAARARLAARGVIVIDEPVVEVTGESSAISEVRVGAGLGADGRGIPIDALFIAGTPRPHDGFLSQLGLTRIDGPMGELIEVDPLGRTSDPRVWAVGNVVAPFANVPVSMGNGSMTGAAVNATLTAEDFDRAVAAGEAADATEFWEGHYGRSERVWSGQPNAMLVSLIAELDPERGRAIDLGCGEGGDAIWLAEQGFEVLGIDISATATTRAERAARERGLGEERVRFEASDLTRATFPGHAQLVTANFFQAPMSFARSAILRRAANALAPGGYLLLVSHASPPSWSDGEHSNHGGFITPPDEMAGLELDPTKWEVVVAELRTRTITDPNGEFATIDDSVVAVRRR
ncbi:NAD(P)/FAD-dependent oxidoreductase [Microbacterium lacus]|uniref:FAD-dependent oxidoreductase n=1 Tax=Microbacterium lacus TaxID=415217 RepID=UPI00384F3C5F